MASRTFRVQEGSSNFKPDVWCPIWRKGGLFFDAYFRKGCDYLLDEEDQQDWNKLIGITYSINPTHKTVMVGWRWNPEIEKIELNAYYHVNKGRDFTEPLMTVDLDQRVTGRIDILKNDYKIHFSKKVPGEPGLKYVEHSFPHKRNPRWIGRMINPWFGGADSNNDGLGGTAPQNMQIDINWTKI